MPLSQMPHKNPYVKDNVMDEGHLDDAKNEDIGNDDSTVEATYDILLADDSEEYINKEEEEGKETDSSSQKEDSENDDIAKNWVHFNDGHMLER